MSATKANVVPIMPGEASEPVSDAPLKHYRDRTTQTPLCGAPKTEGCHAKAWKKVTCEDCFEAKRAPGRPTKDEDAKPKKPKVTVITDEAPNIDDQLGAEISILLSAFVITPACIRMKKAPPPTEMVAQLGPATVELLDHYGFKEQMDHPALKLTITAAAIGFAIYRSPTIEDETELMKAHGIEINPA